MSESSTNSAETLTAELLTLLDEYSRITAWLELPLKDTAGENLRTRLEARQQELAVSIADVLKRARAAGLRLTLRLPWSEQPPETIPQEEFLKYAPPSLDPPRLPDIVERLAARIDQEQEFSEITKIFREFTTPPTEDKSVFWTLLAYIVARLRHRTKKRGGVWPPVFGEVDDFCRRHGLERVHGTFNIDCAKECWDKDAAVHLVRLREITAHTP